MNETQTRTETRFYRARMSIKHGQAPVITKGRIYEGERREMEERGRYWVVLPANDQGQEHPWPFQEDFEAYFDEVPFLPGMFRVQWERVDDPESDSVDYVGLEAVLEQFAWLEPFLQEVPETDLLDLRLDHGYGRLRIEYLPPA